MSKRLVILGAGESGVGTAILAKAKGFDVFVSDYNQIKSKYAEQLAQQNIISESGQHTESLILNADEIVKSPGIPDSAPIIIAAREIGISIISEIEFAGRFTNAKKICITGSNGKTTTTSMIYAIYKNAGYNVGVAGNIGKSFARQVAENDFDIYILELSSFQLDGMIDFRADIAVITNITPDHLDRYDNDFQKYIDSKFKVTQNQTKNDCLIYCADDEVINCEVKKRKLEAQLLPCSIKIQGNNEIFGAGGAFVTDGEININIKNDLFTMTIRELALQGQHNTYNSMFSGIAARVNEIRKSDIRNSLADFSAIPHRLEMVCKVRGVTYINDSKATNINSTWYALESMKTPTIWIVGGVDKGNDYTELLDLVRDKVKAIICLGKDSKKIHNTFEAEIPVILDAMSMDEAINTAYNLAKKDDTVLLSPCCASFDLFDNYEDRGNQFKKYVKKL